uniref:Uncharacterized protein LOC104215770 n=1 Tax=Nicotiana sylvestris TaxID=4096 RepID=A0A1U7V748_NICSY|nr:PREDICTED: uncharacterized protein LOC104215770 [Nicotiana sylvestris]
MRQDNDNAVTITESAGHPQVTKDKGKAKEMQYVDQGEEWPALANNSRLTLGTTVITTKNVFQILQHEEERMEETRPPDLGGGDFNAILNVQDIISKVPVKSADIKDLAELCHDIGIAELPWIGDYFTWIHKQQGDDRVWSRIDRMFGNDVCMMNYSHLSTEYREPYISDHSPMSINIRQPRKLTKSPFRFFNVWASHPDFEMIVREEWSSNKVTWKMESIWAKLRRMKRQFRKLNEAEFKGIDEKIDQARQNIHHIQSQMQNSYSDLLQAQEKEWLQKLETCIKGEATEKQIVELQTLSGSTITEHTAIKEEIISFYKSLMGNNAHILPPVDKMVMREGPTLTQQQQQSLIDEVTRQDIDEALKGI